MADFFEDGNDLVLYTLQGHKEYQIFASGLKMTSSIKTL